MIYKVNNLADGWKISELIYSLMTQDKNGASKYLFGCYEDATGQSFIEVNLDRICPIVLTQSSAATMKKIGDLLGLSTEERATIKAHILANNPIQLINILPSILEEYTPIYIQL